MNDQQKHLVQTSFQAVVPIAELAATLFYSRLFTLDPSLRPLFKEDMMEQKRKLIAALQLTVKSLYDLDKLIPALQSLGRNHVKYGVQDAHYETVGAALIWTLEQGLGEDFTDEVRDAWVAAYTVISSVMQEAANLELVAA